MRTTTLIALIGACAADVTLENSCKAAKSTTCTAELCWADSKLADTKTYLSCTDFDTDADKCQFAGEDCTPAICADHEVQDKSTDKTAKDYYWSQQCTYTQVQNMRLKPVTDTAEWTKVHDKTTSDLASATSSKKTACPKKDTATAACTSATTDLEKQTAYEAANTAWYTPAQQDTLQAADLKNCKAESTSADCDALKTTTDAALTKAKTATSAAKKAYTACDAKTYKTAEDKTKACAADLTAQTGAETKEAQVQKWVDNVDAALTNVYDADTQKWLTTWFEEKFTSSETLADAQALQKTANDNYNSAKTAWDTAKAKSASTLKTQTSTAAAHTKKVDDATTKAWDAAKKAHTDAVSAETKADTKQSFLETWSKWADSFMKNDQDRQFVWMKNGMEQSATKEDAQKFQTKNTADLKKAEAADDKDSTVATKAKVAELKKWVAAGDKILTNAWDKDSYAQDWQFTWFKNECEALMTKDEMEQKQIELTYDQTMSKKKLAAALKLQASTEKEVTAAKAQVAKKTTVREDARADKDTGAAGKLAWGSANKALANAEDNQKFQEKEHQDASDDVAQWTAKDAVLAKWLEWADARLDNTYQSWQVTWMANKIAGMKSKASAEAVQAANESTLKSHEASVKTATGDDKTTLEHQIAQETSWVAKGKAALADSDNLNTWHTNALKAAISIKSTEALLKEDDAACTASSGSQACTWKVADTAQLKTLKADKAARDEKYAKASKVVKAKQTTDEGKTKEEARAELAALRANATEASHALEETAASIKAEDCATTNADTLTCEDLSRTYDSQASALKAAKAAVTAQTTYLDTQKFPTSSDATIAIIILCVSAFVCISGGCAWNYHDKKKAEKEDAERKAANADVENKGKEEGAMDAVDAPPRENALNFYNDDCYKAMVDSEY